MSMRATAATAAIAGHVVVFTPCHREFNDTRPVMTVGVWFGVSLEDLTAALWVLVEGGRVLADLLAPLEMHTAVAETLFNDNGAVDAARRALAEVTPDCPQWVQLADLRDAVDVFYGARPRPARPALAAVTR